MIGEPERELGRMIGIGGEGVLGGVVASSGGCDIRGDEV